MFRIANQVRTTHKLLRRSFASVTTSDTSLTVSSVNATFPYIWLRDSCPCPSCIHPSNRQKLHRSSDFPDLPSEVKPSPGGVKVTDQGLSIKWESGHESTYPKEFLETYASSKKLSAFHKDVEKKTWTLESISKVKELYVTYDSLSTPTGLLTAIDQLTQYGLLFVTGVPNKETSHEKCELRNLGEKFSEIRTTFYGQFFDVQNVKNSINIAYTNLDLGVHMDILYFQSPPRWQILHCLRNRVIGGASYFVDAIHAAHELYRADPEAFALLASTPVAYHYINDGHHYHQTHPTIELNPEPEVRSDGLPDIAYVNYSPPFQAPLPLSTPPAFYSALSKYAKILNDPANTYTYTLKEGDAVLFDNRRALHARTAFEEIEGQGAEGETNRWLKGCYLEGDAIYDRGRVLRGFHGSG
ncbi:hypothetical protein JAAARDRAFT_140934 [Jaapia argillacea MUCL 33604]|uniref:TauD/TfdA-like domain-containing protein n=1 Tax=Jaapia argillacea MUCL 33604 TaxID=933084 RepID=A0A067P8I7_9AGAM|nr:hypothetical protein JAAARDRAFT_140934 [Jaapia argillacea MUCL 33604]